MPIVRVELFSGRSSEKKAKLADAITTALAAVDGIKPENTVVIFSEVPREGWFVGGRPLSLSAPPE